MCLRTAPRQAQLVLKALGPDRQGSSLPHYSPLPGPPSKQQAALARVHQVPVGKAALRQPGKGAAAAPFAL